MRIRTYLPIIAIVMLLACAPSSIAAGLKLLLSNDDGFEAANLRVLYDRLKKEGHDILVSAPVHNQSGRGGAIDALKPIRPLNKASRYGTVAEGSPGIGTDAENPDLYYVNGTPVMALLYGLQVLAPKRWGAAPDLVISGPNEGPNLGAVVIVSGTANNAFMALSFGIPAMAVSWDGPSKSFAKLEEGDRAYEAADIVVTLLNSIRGSSVDDKPLLPKNVGLNVNIPKFKKGQGKQLRYEITRLGGQALPTIALFEQLENSPYAVAAGAGSELPGISVLTQSHPETDGLQVPIDQDPHSESMAIRRGVITISPIRMAPEGTAVDARYLSQRLGTLLDGE